MLPDEQFVVLSKMLASKGSFCSTNTMSSLCSPAVLRCLLSAKLVRTVYGYGTDDFPAPRGYAVTEAGAIAVSHTLAQRQRDDLAAKNRLQQQQEQRDQQQASDRRKQELEDERLAKDSRRSWYQFALRAVIDIVLVLITAYLAKNTAWFDWMEGLFH